MDHQGWRAAILVLLAAAPAPPAARADILLIAEAGANAVGQYDAATGNTIKANFITGIIAPGAMTLDNSGTLFVISNGSRVFEFNAMTGAPIALANSITGFSSSSGVAVDNNGHVFVTYFNSVREYSSSTGALITASFITGLNNPSALIRDNNGNFYVGNDGSQMVSEYDHNGALITTFSLPGVSDTRGFALDGSNHLFVGNTHLNTAEGEYDATTGAAIDDSFIHSVPQSFGLALDGNDLYVAYIGSNVVGEYDATTGAVIKTNFITGILDPAGMVVQSSQATSVPAPGSIEMLLSVAATGMALGVWRRCRNKTAPMPMSNFQPG